MFTRCVCFVALLAVVVLGSSRAAEDEDIKKEMKKMEGTWQMVSLENEGSDGLAKEELAKNAIHLTVKGDTFKVADSGETYAEGTFKIVEVKGKIRKNDLTYTKPTDWGKKPVPQLAEWIDDDTFRVVVPDPTSKEVKRPTEFSAKKGSSQILAVYKRVKK